jgi:hypothetical protein
VAPLASYNPTAPVQTANHKNAVLLYQLRWIAVVGQVLTIAFAQVVLVWRCRCFPWHSCCSVCWR